MPKAWRGAVVEKVVHPKTKRSGVVRLDTRSMTFWAREVDTDTRLPVYSNASGDAVRSWLMEQLARSTAADLLEWEPVIEIEYGAGDPYSRYEAGPGARIEIGFTRYYLALTKDKAAWRKLSWAEGDPKSAGALDPLDRFAASTEYGRGPKAPQRHQWDTPFTLPNFREGGRRGNKAVVRYTPELWAGLSEVVTMVERAGNIIADLVGTKQGVAQLATGGLAGVKLLGKGKAGGAEK